MEINLFKLAELLKDKNKFIEEGGSFRLNSKSFLYLYNKIGSSILKIKF